MSSNSRKWSVYFFLGQLTLNLDYPLEEKLAVLKTWEATGENHPFPALFLGATYLQLGEDAVGKRYINEVTEQMIRELAEQPDDFWKELHATLAAAVFKKATRRYYAGTVYSMIREYDLAKREFDRFLDEGGSNAKPFLVRALVKSGFAQSADAANTDHRIFDQGLERYMIDLGNNSSLEALR